MKLLPTVAFAFGLLLTMPVAAADKPSDRKNWWWPWKKEEAKPAATPAAKTRKKTTAKKAAATPGRPSTLPPKSEMIILPPTDPAIAGKAPAKLFTSDMSGKDLVFFTAAVDAGRWQALLVGLLQTRAKSEHIQALGAALAETQEVENRQIARLAALKGWAVSTAPTAAQKQAGAELEKQADGDFDKAVMDKLIAASQQSVSAYEAAAQSNDADIKSFAAQMLPLAQKKSRLVENMTGAGQAAAGLFRTGAPPKATPPPKAE